MSTGPACRRRAHPAAGMAAVVACLAVGTGLATGPAAAQGDDQAPGEGARTWSVQPADADGADGRARFDYQGPAGESVTDHAQVSNFSDQPLTLRVYSQDAINTPSGGFTLLPGDRPPTDLGAWIGLDEQVTVAAGDSVVVPFTLTVPATATPGDHSGGIVAALTTEASDEQGNPVLVDHRVGARIHLRIDGELNPALRITQMQADYGRLWAPFTAGEVTVSYTVTNIGNVRLQAGQELTVRGPFGLGARTVALERLSEILPGQSVTATVGVESVAPLLLLSGDLTLHPVAPLAADPRPPAASGQATAWAVPWPELLIAVLLGLAVWGAIWRRRRLRRRTAATLAEAVATARERAREEALQEVGEQATQVPRAETGTGAGATATRGGSRSEPGNGDDGEGRRPGEA